VVAAARTAGISTGAFGGTPERAAVLRRRGFDHVVVATDSGLLTAGAAAALGAGAAHPSTTGLVATVREPYRTSSGGSPG